MLSNLLTFSMECDAPVTAFCFDMMYTDGVGRKKVDGIGKEYTISELVHHLSCDREMRAENSK